MKYMNSAVKLPQNTKAEEMKLVQEFIKMNPHIEDVENFKVKTY